MKITICGSIAFKAEMNELQKKLEAVGHEVKQPPTTVFDANGKEMPVEQYYKIRKVAKTDDAWIWERKGELIKEHFDKIAWGDIILVTNYNKNDINGYVGGNTLIEMGVAFYLNKKIYLLNEIPAMPYQEEILGMQPIVINNDLSLIK